ncbi:hypothetical protein TB2_024503 [Malus domestica]
MGSISSLNASCCALTDVANDHEPLWTTVQLNFSSGCGIQCNFACVSMAKRGKQRNEFLPTSVQMLKHHLAILACVPKDVALFAAGAVARIVAESVTAPLDRIKILMQTHGV